jgi:hypothetical protein
MFKLQESYLRGVKYAKENLFERDVTDLAQQAFGNNAAIHGYESDNGVGAVVYKPKHPEKFITAVEKRRGVPTAVGAAAVGLPLAGIGTGLGAYLGKGDWKTKLLGGSAGLLAGSLTGAGLGRAYALNKENRLIEELKERHYFNTYKG